MTERQIEALMLHRQGKNHAQIARHLHIRRESVCRLLSRGRARLTRCLRAVEQARAMHML